MEKSWLRWSPSPENQRERAGVGGTVAKEHWGTIGAETTSGQWPWGGEEESGKLRKEEERGLWSGVLHQEVQSWKPMSLQLEPAGLVLGQWWEEVAFCKKLNLSESPEGYARPVISITESQNHLGWKRPPSSPSPTSDLTLTSPPLNHITKLYI